MNSRLMGNLIRNPEPYAIHIFRQPVWVLPHDPIDFHSICIINPRGQDSGNPVFLKEYHNPPHIFLFFHLDSDFSGFLFADPFNFRKALRLFFNDAERIFSKLFYNPCSQRCPYPFDCAGAQISFYADFVIRLRHMIVLHLTLCAI